MSKSCKDLISKCYLHNRVNYALTVLTTILTNGFALGISLILRELMNTISGETESKNLNELAWMILIYLLLMILVYGANYLVEPRFLFKAMKQYKEYALKQLSAKSLFSFQKESTSAYLSSLTNDVSVIESDYLESEFAIVGDCVLLFGSIILMLYYSPMLTLIVTILAALPMIVSIIFGRQLEPVEKQVSNQHAAFTSVLKDCLDGFSVVKSFRAETDILKLIFAENKHLEKTKYRRQQVKLFVGGISLIASLLAQFGVFFAGVWFVVHGQNMTAGTVILFVNLMNFVISPIRELPSLLAGRRAAIGLVEKLASILGQNCRDGDVSIPTNCNQGIRLQELSFSYEPGQRALNKVSIEFEPKKSYAIVGSSGSGKSTLLHMLCGGSDTYDGSILIDDIEIKDISQESLYSLISVVQQNVFIFNASIRDNVTMFRNFPEADIAEALRLAHLTELIEQRGATYLCGEGGSGLSGGEKQRIAIARSLLHKSPFLLVDEATSSLDPETAYQVSTEILDLQDITRIVVTHSLEKSLLVKYDQIIVMKSGSIAEIGTFETLMEQKGLFYALYIVAQ